MDISLDEYIKKSPKKGNFINNKRKTQHGRKSNLGESSFKKQIRIGTSRPKTVTDARLKIIQKKRVKIKDAREKLAEIAKKQDARLKIERNKQKKQEINNLHGRSVGLRRLTNENKLGLMKNELRERDETRTVRPKPISLKTSQQHKERLFGFKKRDTHTNLERLSLKPILRTVENDVMYSEPMQIDDDDIIEYVPNIKRDTLNFKIVTHNDRAKKSNIVERKEKPMPPSILKKHSTPSTSVKHSPQVEYRIIVSNLRNTVTEADIQELFADVGGLLESRLVRPGTAEVLYSSLRDAEKAVNLYHNRQLDGQPMNCFLVNPHSVNKPSSNGLSSKLQHVSSSSTEIIPDISTFHKVLFSNH